MFIENTDIAEDFTEDEGDFITYIEVRDYSDYTEEEVEAGDYDGVGDIPVWYVRRDENGDILWIKTKLNQAALVDDPKIETRHFFFCDGPLNGIFTTEIEVTPVAVKNEMIYFKPVEE